MVFRDVVAETRQAAIHALLHRARMLNALAEGTPRRDHQRLLHKFESLAASRLLELNAATVVESSLAASRVTLLLRDGRLVHVQAALLSPGARRHEVRAAA